MIIDQGLIDDLVFFFTLLFFAFMTAVYLLRARRLSNLELKVSPWLSVFLVPFFALLLLNLETNSNVDRLPAELPVIAYLIYDLWYRAFSHNPNHHPRFWLPGLATYLFLFFLSCFGLMWYGYMVSFQHGFAITAAFLVLLASFVYYQWEHRGQS